MFLLFKRIISKPKIDIHEFNNIVKEKFIFLVEDYGFIFSEEDARGTYESRVVFQKETVKINVGIWGQGNELCIIVTPQEDKKAPSLDIWEILNAITGDDDYFTENIVAKVPDPISKNRLPQYFDLCADELKENCNDILQGDTSRWVSFIKYKIELNIRSNLRFNKRRDQVSIDETLLHQEDLVNYVKLYDPNYSLNDVFQKWSAKMPYGHIEQPHD
jgi:hypothetical protein